MQDRGALRDLLTKGARQLGIHMETQEVDKCIKYMDMLLEWNQKINLTAIKEEKEVIVKHFLDSLTILPLIKQSDASVIDVGTGAGFPGIPLKMLKGDIRITLLDSLKKRTKFLKEVINMINAENVTILHGRAEDFGRDNLYREKFNYSVARAVAALPVLVEYCLPFLEVGGVFIAMKGRNMEEINDSRNAIKTLGGEIEEIVELSLPFTDIKRNIICIRKLRHTSTQYPRKSGKPSKEPLK